MITKTEIADILGISDTLINDYIYSWAQDIFYTITGFKETESQKWHKEFVQQTTHFILLPDRSIKTIDAIKMDNTTYLYTNFSEYTLNPDTGFIYFDSAISKDVFLEIQYTANAHIYTDVDGYLISLLVYKGILTFTPNNAGVVKTIRIGRYSRSFSDVFKGGGISSLITYLEEEIKRATALVLGEKDGFGFGVAG